MNVHADIRTAVLLHPASLRLLCLWGLSLGIPGGAVYAGVGERLYAVDADQPALFESVTALAKPPLTLDWFSQSGEERGGVDLLQGLLLPGFDQAQHGHWWKTAAFVAVEAGILLAASALNAEGDDLDREFKQFADDHWDYDRYVSYRQEKGEFAMAEGWLNRHIDPAALAAAGSQAEIDALFFGAVAEGNDVFDANAGEGSHPLPGFYTDGYVVGQEGAWDHFTLDRTQQCYEMIGKYAQFQRGWDGYGADDGFEFVAQQTWRVRDFSAQSTEYMAMRSESNDKLIVADRIMGLLIVNHLASFLDVVIQGRKEQAPRLEMRATRLETGSGGRAGLGLAWNF